MLKIFLPNSSFAKFVLAVALLLGVAFGVFSSLHAPAQAQDADADNFVVQAGVPGLGAAEALIFAPQRLDVHRGDTVSWMVNGFHNVRLTEEGLAPLVLIPGVDDVEVPQVNPAVAFPTLNNGEAYTGGPANSGLPAGQPGGPPDAGGIYSLVMDVEPGSYNYLCDVHPGMVGVINVVDDGTAVPSPTEVMLQAKQEADEALAMGSEAVQAEIEAEAGVNTVGDDGVAYVQTGTSNTGRTTVNRYFGLTTVIEPGQTVTWEIPEGSPDPHTVTWPPLRGQDIAPIPQDEGPPILSFGPGFTPNIPKNNTVTSDGEFNSGLLLPGQTFSLTFPNEGAYPFVCNIHPGMEGVVVVQAAE